MADFTKLDSETRCFASVGKFLQSWAIMEEEMHEAIAKAFGLEDLQMLVLCKNIQLRDKIHILRAAISLSFLSKARCDEFDAVLVSLADYSPTRNMFADDLFGPTKDGLGVSSCSQSEGETFVSRNNMEMGAF